MVALASLGLWGRGDFHTDTNLETNTHTPIVATLKVASGQYFIITPVAEGDGLELKQVSGDFMVGEG